MHSNDTQKIIADLNEFLMYRHPSSVLQFITSMMVGLTHFDKKKQPGKAEIDIAWDNYFKLLRSNIDKRLSLISSRSYSNVRRKVLSVPPQVYEKKKLDEIITLLGNMPTEEALDFMAEVTANWCFSVPVNFLPLLPADVPDACDESIANAIYVWLVRYSDLWN